MDSFLTTVFLFSEGEGKVSPLSVEFMLRAGDVPTFDTLSCSDETSSSSPPTGSAFSGDFEFLDSNGELSGGDCNMRRFEESSELRAFSSVKGSLSGIPVSAQTLTLAPLTEVAPKTSSLGGEEEEAD